MADNLPEPQSRKESYLAKAAGMDTTIPDAPESREEQYLAAIAEGGGGGGGGSYTAGTGIDITNNEISVDTDTIQEKLTAGTNITIADNVISAAGGGSVTPVQTTGTSTTDVMSQNATTSMIYADPSTMNRIKIGQGASSSIADNGIEIGHESGVLTANGIAIGTNATVKSFSSESIAIGTFADAGSEMTEAIGYFSCASKEKAAALGARTSATHSFSVALGAGATTSAAGEVNIGTGQLYTTKGYNSSNYRLLTGLYDPQSAHDAATKGYVDGLVGNVASALNAINNGSN